MSDADILAGIFAEARKSMQEASQRKFYPPRMITESLRTMARHLSYSESEAQALLEPTLLHQFFLPAALSPTLVGPSRLFPQMYERVQKDMHALGNEPVVFLFFHFSGVPLLSSLMNDDLAARNFTNRRFLLAPRNAAWLNQDRGRWLREVTILADRAGLRTLMSGLRKGTISHLGLLVDGPQDPASEGVYPVTGIPMLGFRTGLLKWILAVGIPVVPVTNHWEGEQLQYEWHNPLSPYNGIETVAGLIGRQLRQHPEQWFNWPAASLRT